MADNIATKRWSAAKAYAVGVSGASAGSAAPHVIPGLGLGKHSAIAVVDANMLAGIYYAYFGERPSSETVLSMLRDAGVVLSLAGGVTYAGIKTMDWIANEFLQVVPVLGQGLAAAITGTVTGALGAAWWLSCDAAYKQETSPALVLRAAFA
ncbi:MAG TPA: hypothetical protein VEX67_05405 [Solirubrobacteraceae bacterium]|nr:hypothetical protein [Solirubrobacteraceae bacterium]